MAHVDIARRAFDAISQKPSPDFDTINELMAADHEFVDALSENVFGGRGFQAWLGVFNETWEAWELQPGELIAVDDDRVLMLYRFVATGKGSHIAVDEEMANLMTIRGGEIVRTQAFSSVEDARAALAVASD